MFSFDLNNFLNYLEKNIFFNEDHIFTLIIYFIIIFLIYIFFNNIYINHSQIYNTDNRYNDYRWMTKKQQNDLLEPGWSQKYNKNNNNNLDNNNLDNNEYIVYDNNIKYVIDDNDNKYIIDDNNNKYFIDNNNYETNDDYDLDYQNQLKKILKKNNKSKYTILYSDN